MIDNNFSACACGAPAVAAASTVPPETSATAHRAVDVSMPRIVTAPPPSSCSLR